MLRDLVRVCTPRIGHVGVLQEDDVLDAIQPQQSIVALFDTSNTMERPT